MDTQTIEYINSLLKWFEQSDKGYRFEATHSMKLLSHTYFYIALYKDDDMVCSQPMIVEPAFKEFYLWTALDRDMVYDACKRVTKQLISQYENNTQGESDTETVRFADVMNKITGEN